MKKLITLPLDFTESLIQKVDGVVLGVKDLSIGFNTYETLDTLVDKIKYFKSKNVEVFISLNKNMYNSDLEYLKKIIILISTLNIDGLMYYDLSVYNIVNTNKLNIPLYWNQEHLTTNYMTCNFWQKKGVKGSFLSSDITFDEILKIREKTSMKLIVQVYGYVKMMSSSRKLVTNYLKHIGENKTNYSYEIYEKKLDKKYPIIEDDNGTITLTDKCINGIRYIERLNTIDYLFFNSLKIDDFELVIDAFNNNDLSYFDDIEDLFLSKNTIYKVKR